MKTNVAKYALITGTQEQMVNNSTVVREKNVLRVHPGHINDPKHVGLMIQTVNTILLSKAMNYIL